METFLHELARAQVESGLDVRVLVHNHQGRTTTTDQGDDKEIIRVGSFGTLFFTPVSPAFRSRLKQQISQFQPDIVHLHMPNPSAFWVMTVAAAHGIPWVVHWHADVVSSALNWRVKLAYRFYRPMEQSLLKCARRIIVTSPPYLKSSQPLAPWQDKCRVIPLGMKDQPNIPSSGEKNTWNADALRVLAIGRLTYYKGFEYLIRAAGKVDAIQVNLVGDGEKYEELQRLIRSKGLEQKIKLLGKQSGDALSHLLQGCHCLCLPSIERTEAFGMVLLEAARAGKPAVVTDVPGSGMSWVVEEGKTGITVPTGNVEKLAAALQYLATHEAECAEMGKRARKRFDTMFRIETVEKQIFELYKDIAPTTVTGNHVPLRTHTHSRTQ